MRKVRGKVKKGVCEKEAGWESNWFGGRLGKRRRKRSTKVKEIVRNKSSIRLSQENR